MEENQSLTYPYCVDCVDCGFRLPSLEALEADPVFLKTREL